MTVVQHSSDSNEWYTPRDYCSMVRHTLGGTIDLDPATSKAANEVVRAKEICTIDEYDESEVHRKWEEANTIYLNPPGGVYRVGKHVYSEVALWWNMLTRWYGFGRSAVFCCFNLNLLQTVQSVTGMHPLDFHVALPRRRVKYDRIVQGERVPGEAPSHPSAFICLTDKQETHRRFTQSFGTVGYVTQWKEIKHGNQD